MSTEYHKIETLYERDERTHKLVEPLILKNRVYGIVNPWVWTEKIDGTNIRVIWNRLTAQCGHVIAAATDAFCTTCGQKIESFGRGKITFGGKTDNAQIHADLVKWLYDHITPEAMAAVFPEDVVNVVVYGEGYGAGIQKGGGLYSPIKKLIVFDVRVENWWLSDENMRDVAAKLSLDAVPLIGEMSLAEATEKTRAGFKSAINGGLAQAEGMVGRPCEALFDKKGHRLIVKLKTKDFAGAVK